MLLSLFAIAFNAGAQITYTTNTDNTLNVAGYTGPGGAVVIPATNNGLAVTSIGESSFMFRTNLTSIVIPETVTNIGDFAFMYCTSLTSVTLPGSITNIGRYVFEQCESLTNLILPESVTHIGYNAFGQCVSMTNVTLGSNVAYIELDAFRNCFSLKSVHFEGNAPVSPGSFYQDDYATMYFLPWRVHGPFYAALPTKEWLPEISGFGVQSNQFGFQIKWARNQTVVVQASTNLSETNWLAASTNLLTNGIFYFGDTLSTDSPARFYRAVRP